MLPIDSAAPTAVSPALHPSVAEMAERAGTVLAGALGADLKSFTVVGHAVVEGLDKDELLQSLVVAGDDADLFGLAQRLADVSGRLKKQQVGPPLLMTDAYIDRSHDCFPIELLHMQLLHHTVAGDDPLASLSVDKAHVRSQCEREAKRYLLHIRQGVMRHGHNAALLHGVLVELLEAVLPLFGAVLYYKDVGRPRDRAALLEAFGRSIGADITPFQQDLGDASGQRPLERDRYAPVLRGCYAVLESLAKWLDESA